MRRSFDFEDVLLLAELRRAGIRLTRDGDNLRIKAERTPPAELLEQVRQRKAHLLALLALLDSPDTPDKPTEAPARPSTEASACPSARPSTEALADWLSTLDRLARDALAVQRGILAEGERRGYPAVTLGVGRTLAGGRLAWAAFARTNCPAPHRDAADLADWLARNPARADDDLLA